VLQMARITRHPIAYPEVANVLDLLLKSVIQQIGSSVKINSVIELINPRFPS
jgi:hypothetical protein